MDLKKIYTIIYKGETILIKNNTKNRPKDRVNPVETTLDYTEKLQRNAEHINAFPVSTFAFCRTATHSRTHA
jgi:hypothetical protein